MKTNISEKFKRTLLHNTKNIKLKQKNKHCEDFEVRQDGYIQDLNEVLSLFLHVIFLPVLLLIQLDNDLERIFDQQEKHIRLYNNL